jgi:hypothetical protein
VSSGLGAEDRALHLPPAGHMASSGRMVLATENGSTERRSNVWTKISDCGEILRRPLHDINIFKAVFEHCRFRFCYQNCSNDNSLKRTKGFFADRLKPTCRHNHLTIRLSLHGHNLARIGTYLTRSQAQKNCLERRYNTANSMPFYLT